MRVRVRARARVKVRTFSIILVSVDISVSNDCEFDFDTTALYVDNGISVDPGRSSVAGILQSFVELSCIVGRGRFHPTFATYPADSWYVSTC